MEFLLEGVVFPFEPDARGGVMRRADGLALAPGVGDPGGAGLRHPLALQGFVLPFVLDRSAGHGVLLS